MPQQKKMPGAAREKRNCWMRGNGSYSFRGDLKRGIALNKKYLNRKVRHSAGILTKGNGYRRICRTVEMVNFT